MAANSSGLATANAPDFAEQNSQLLDTYETATIENLRNHLFGGFLLVDDVLNLTFLDLQLDMEGTKAKVAIERSSEDFNFEKIDELPTDGPRQLPLYLTPDLLIKINPGAVEVCNGVDDDCDGLVDTADPHFVDTTPPSVICKNFTVALDTFGAAAIFPNDVFDTGSDDCGSVIPSGFLPNAFDCSHIGGNAVVLTVGDGNGRKWLQGFGHGSGGVARCARYFDDVFLTRLPQ